MKMLTEVIEAQERCGTYPNCHFCFLHAGPVCGWIRDALYYLKMYRSDKAQWEADKKAYEDERQKAIHATKKARERYIALAKDTKDELAVLRDFWAEQQANPALSWEELKQMEGKPVWVEDVICEKREWLLISMVEKNDIWYVDKWAHKEKFNRDGFGRLWQAYRKERE